ncbi:oligopeptide transporter 6 [Purpureocillium takamizusanense]|uniref:Oligopeptide transporter 6 n=1 Tax=Purpureocillium takamizusanense TaxID=2060973 RepID=A0A9Q8Q588_9HYPO|nr:oligopeptide transporter 6 [Purpureocillium takamizusanense]UNI13290.1 oligopeptide transporter 6 [Purpureocillium takamizusanense]
MASSEPKAQDVTNIVSAEGPNEKHGPSASAVGVDPTPQEIREQLGGQGDQIPPLDDIQYVTDRVRLLTVEECQNINTKMLEDHANDYNFSEQLREKLATLAQGPSNKQSLDDWELQLKTETAVNRFFSPYPEVRAVAIPTDDVNMPCETIRSHFLGLAWAVVGQFTNSLFNSRFPSIVLSSPVTQLLLYPCGLFLAKILPDWGLTVRGKRVSLNPGPWTYKEQMLSTIIVNVSLTTAYCFFNIQTQTVYYKDQWLTPAYGILLLLSTQLMGLGFAGMLRRFVVYPVEALWPSILPTVALNRALLVPEKQVTINGWSISRYKFFFAVFAAMLVYFWIPGYLFTALSTFSWISWIAPNNFHLNIITGSQLGLGFNPLASFDWSVIAASSQPLTYPFFATLQFFIGVLLAGFIIIGVYYTNTRWTGYLPPNSSAIFDNTGARYNISKVIENGILVEDKYKAYSPVFYSAANLVGYTAFFAFYPLTIVFVTLDLWRPLLKTFKTMATSTTSSVKRQLVSFRDATLLISSGQFREAGRRLRQGFDGEGSIYDGFDDPFTETMRHYPEVPDWWFFSIALCAFLFAIIILCNWPQLQTPVWTIFFVIGLNLVFLIPLAYLYSISGTPTGLNVASELIVGYALPGHPEALMFVKAFGYIIGTQADNYVSDQKMGLYARIPPRAIYRGQLISAIVSAIVCYGVVQFVDTIPDICSPTQASKFTCASGSLVYFSSSIVWGAIGPKRTYSQIYPAMQYGFLLGFLLAVVWWGAKAYGPRFRQLCKDTLPAPVFLLLNTTVFTPASWLKNVHPSIVITGFLIWAPLNLAYYTGALYLAFYFMYYLKRNKTAWWEKYTYVLSAALTGGLAFSAIIMFFAVQYYPKELHWWGNDVNGNTIDGGAGRTALLPVLPDKGYFGPDSWY